MLIKMNPILIFININLLKFYIKKINKVLRKKYKRYKKENNLFCNFL